MNTLSSPSRRAWPWALVLVLGASVAFAGDTPVEPRAPAAILYDRPVTKAELAGYWFDRYPQEYARVLDEMLDERAARMEAAKIGLRVPRAALDAAIRTEVEARTKLVRDVYGDQGRLAEWVREGYGLDVAGWQREILAPRLESVLLRKRIVRLHTRRKLRVHARVIVTFDPAKAQRVMQKLRAGADFSLVALKESEDATKKVGGVLPPISKGDLAQFPIVEARLLQATGGQLLGPWRVQVEGREQIQIYKVVRREEAWQLSGRALLDALERDVASTPVTQAELDGWQRHVRAEGRIRYLRPDGKSWDR